MTQQYQICTGGGWGEGGREGRGKEGGREGGEREGGGKYIHVHKAMKLKHPSPLSLHISQDLLVRGTSVDGYLISK